MGVTRELPQYQSHKKVRGLKIKTVKLHNQDTFDESDGSGILSFEKDGYLPRKVSRDYMRKHKPQAGGYFVVYKDGYESWSPGDVFEAGNTLIE